MATCLTRCTQHRRVVAAAAVQAATGETSDKGADAVPIAGEYIFCSTFEDAHAVMHERASNILANSTGRCSIGIVGAPGSGKTTAAALLADSLNKAAAQQGPGVASQTQDVAIVVPMDGFHYYRSELDEMPDPALAHARRGAAFTFNARAFVDCVQRIMAAPQNGEAVAVPSFDHGAGDPVEGDIVVQPHHRIVLVEGLYVLLREEPWSELQGALTEAWMLHVEPSLSLAQVVERQVGLGNTREAACERVGNNDLVNTDAVRLRSRRPHLLLETSAAHRAELRGTVFDYAAWQADAHRCAAAVPKA